MADVQQAPVWADISGGGREEPVIYYRKPDGWIVAGATQPSVQLGMIRKGFQPLPQYGRIQHSEDFWGPILRHPDGPAEFPVEQILSFRWYRKDKLPDLRPLVQMGRDLVRQGIQPTIVFPQLRGVKITEFPCPECSRDFHNPLHLGSHLRVMHGYDRSEILKYGEAMNIDFSKTPGGKQLLEYKFDDIELPTQQQVEEEAYDISTVSASSPATEEVRAQVEEARCDECDWVSKPETQNTQHALVMHKKVKHPEVVPA